MKKILSLTLLLAMSLMVFTFLPARAEDDTSVNIQLTATPVTTSIGSPDLLEKISSPDQLKYFKVMKKENGALYGIRLRSDATNSTTENVSDVLDNKLGNLEKIVSPQLISLYEKIQKIGTTLWGVKKNEVNRYENSEVIQNQYRLVTSDMIECVSKAIDTKDDAMITLTKSSSEKMIVNISARGVCQKDAIASTENQAENLKECVISFQQNHKDIVNNARKERKDVWANYKVEMKACASNSSITDNDFELMIDDGGNDDLNYALVQ